MHAGAMPKPPGERRRRNVAPSIVRLPADGRTGDPPGCPLPDVNPARWAALWKLPQAVEWERLQLVHVIARYALLLDFAEVGDTKMASEARQMEDRLGLSPHAMIRLRWVIGEPETARPQAVVQWADDYRDAG